MTSRYCDVYFSFGPTPGSYILDTPMRFRTSKIPSNVEQRMTNVGKVHWAVVGDNGYASFMYKGVGPEVGEWTWCSSAFESAFPAVQEFITKSAAQFDHADISMTLGSGNTYVIVLPKENVGRWGGINDELDDSLRELDNVRHVALGVGGAHALLFGNRIRWNFYGNYDTLGSLLENADPSIGIKYLAMNRWRAEEFFLVMEDGTIHFQVHKSIEQDIRSVLSCYNIPCSYGAPTPRSLTPQRQFRSSTPTPTGNSLVPYSSQGQLMPPTAMPRFEARAFLKEVVTGVISGTIVTIVTGVAGSCIMM
ncbi:hypothetical protein V8F20_001246 [Naviculisporaceae sp. PSN 640]